MQILIQDITSHNSFQALFIFFAYDLFSCQVLCQILASIHPCLFYVRYLGFTCALACNIVSFGEFGRVRLSVREVKLRRAMLLYCPQGESAWCFVMFQFA